MSQGPQQSRSSAGAATGAGGADAEGGDPALIGRTISGKYRIEKFLGGGAMGAVYKARFAALEKNVAVKVMHSSIAVDPNFVGRFHREAKAASRLDHPNSMRVIDFGEESDGLLYITMEYVEGRDLYRVIHEDWPISNADVGDILMQALAAIAVAHEMGVIHRDLKPENLMMLRAKNDDERDAYVVKVCDFGIAKITEKDEEAKTEAMPGAPPPPAGGQKLTTQGLVVGTPEYMSPEQARGEKLDARSDIYSVGVILYQLLTGRTPFTADTPLAVVLKHITEQPQPPSVHYAGVHKGLEAIAMRALAKDKNERYQTARQMRNAIREALEGRPMPVDIAAATVEAVGPPGTVPVAPGGSVGSVPASAAATPPPRVAAAIESAPTVAGGITASHLTPLGTAAATVEPKKSRKGVLYGLVIAVPLVVAAVGVGAGIYVRSSHAAPHGGRANANGLGGGAPNGSATAEPTTPGTPSTPSAVAAITTKPATAATGETAPPSPNERPGKHPGQHANGTNGTGGGGGGIGGAGGAGGNAGTGATNGKNGGEATPALTAIVAPPPVAPDPPPAVTPATPPPATVPPPATPAPPPPAAFNAQTCRAASAGPVHSNGAVNAKDLNVNNAVATVTSCARNLLHEKPGGPINATVQVRFSDSGQFRGAACPACPPALQSCVSGAGRGMTVKFRSGDVTGEPTFDVPMTITCE